MTTATAEPVRRIEENGVGDAATEEAEHPDSYRPGHATPSVDDWSEMIDRIEAAQQRIGCSDSETIDGIDAAAAYWTLQSLVRDIREWRGCAKAAQKATKAPEPERVVEKPTQQSAADDPVIELSFYVGRALDRTIDRIGAAKTLLDEPDNEPMPWEDVCAAGYTLDGTVKQLETLREGMKRWRADESDSRKAVA